MWRAGTHRDGVRGTRLLGLKGVVARGLGLQSMCRFAGVFLGPLNGGFVGYRFGWGVMSAVLGALAAFTAMPMPWLDEKEEHDNEERTAVA